MYCVYKRPPQRYSYYNIRVTSAAYYCNNIVCHKIMFDENRSLERIYIENKNRRCTYGAYGWRHGHLRGIRRRPWRSDGHRRWLWHDRRHAGSSHLRSQKPRRYWSPLETINENTIHKFIVIKNDKHSNIAYYFYFFHNTKIWTL